VQFGQDYLFTLTSTEPMDIYISGGTETAVTPIEFTNDAAFKKQSYVSFAFSQFPQLSSFTAAVRVNGLEFYTNRFQEVHLNAKFTITSSIISCSYIR